MNDDEKLFIFITGEVALYFILKYLERKPSQPQQPPPSPPIETQPPPEETIPSPPTQPPITSTQTCTSCPCCNQPSQPSQPQPPQQPQPSLPTTITTGGGSVSTTPTPTICGESSVAECDPIKCVRVRFINNCKYYLRINFQNVPPQPLWPGQQIMLPGECTTYWTPKGAIISIQIFQSGAPQTTILQPTTVNSDMTVIINSNCATATIQPGII